jgi:tripartite-type tricarboxylate transporter receptor subunit TctC
MTMVVPFAAGGGADLLGRILAPPLSELLGQPVTVENVGGGGGMTGALRVSRAAPDGYQFVLGTTGTHAQNQSLYKNPLYHAATDFTPVALVAEQPILLIVRKDFPASNLVDFIAYAKANQQKMQFGSAGTGSGVHLACVLFNAAIGVNIVHVPYRGTAPAMQDLIAGRIDYLCIDTPIAIPLIEGGQIKAVAILTRGRSASLPNLPSAQEQGLANFEAANWAAFFMPKGTPAPIVEKLAAASATATGSAAVQKRMKEIGVDPVAPDRRSPEYLATFVEAEIAKWAGPVKASGLATD